jgi:hypothetical protein
VARLEEARDNLSMPFVLNDEAAASLTTAGWLSL